MSSDGKGKEDEVPSQEEVASVNMDSGGKSKEDEVPSQEEVASVNMDSDGKSKEAEVKGVEEVASVTKSEVPDPEKVASNLNNEGIVPFMRHMWTYEPVVAFSVIVGTVPAIAFFLAPKSYKQRINDDVLSVPHFYPPPRRYVEGKTGPPTEV